MKDSWRWGATPAAVVAVVLAGILSGLVASLLGRLESNHLSGVSGRGRHLQAAASSEGSAPTLDDVDFVIFSRPPYNRLERSQIVYYSIATIYLMCGVTLLVGLNLDQSERRRRVARSIVPHEIEPSQVCCFRYMAHKESVPCELSEQYYLDEHLLHLQTARDIAVRRVRLTLWNYITRYMAMYFEALARTHLSLSLLLRAIPTFTRVKRAFLIIVEFNICMLVAAMAINVREHHAPRGVYVLFTCGDAPDCFATVPWALIAAVVFWPIFRFVAIRQMRHTCFVEQTHPSSSLFPLGKRKFASITPRSFFENLCCMRSKYERQKHDVAKSRSCIHRLLQLLWWTTRPAVNELRFYSVYMSCVVLFLMFLVVFCTVVYHLQFTVYLKDSVVYHWLAWALTMFLACVVVLEPLWIFLTDVLWCACTASVAQFWGFGAHSLAATTRYTEVVKQVEDVYVSNLRDVASTRIQRWWLAVLDMYRAIHEQTAAAVKIQAARKKMNQKRKYMRERKWCLKLEVLNCIDLEGSGTSGALMSPQVRMLCDTGNPTTLETNVAWEAGRSATFDETFFVDIKESASMYLTVWGKDLVGDDFVGRGYFDFDDLKSADDNEESEGHQFRVPLYNIQHGERLATVPPRNNGHVEIRVHFLDPLKDACGVNGGEDWMLPRNRMKFALMKGNSGGRLRVGRMLGNMPAGRDPLSRGPTSGLEALEAPTGEVPAHAASASGLDSSEASGALARQRGSMTQSTFARTGAGGPATTQQSNTSQSTNASTGAGAAGSTQRSVPGQSAHGSTGASFGAAAPAAREPLPPESASSSAEATRRMNLGHVDILGEFEGARQQRRLTERAGSVAEVQAARLQNTQSSFGGGSTGQGFRPAMGTAPLAATAWGTARRPPPTRAPPSGPPPVDTVRTDAWTARAEASVDGPSRNAARNQSHLSLTSSLPRIEPTGTESLAATMPGTVPEGDGTPPARWADSRA